MLSQPQASCSRRSFASDHDAVLVESAEFDPVKQRSNILARVFAFETIVESKETSCRNHSSPERSDRSSPPEVIDV